MPRYAANILFLSYFSITILENTKSYILIGYSMH